MNNEIYMYYWVELYPYKSNGLPYIFEIKKEDYREEFYISHDSPYQYEKYQLDNNDELITLVKLTQFELIQIIKEYRPDYWLKNINVNQAQLPEPRYNGYLKHKLYVASDFKTIINTLILTLSNLGYYYYSSKSERELEKFNPDDFSEFAFHKDSRFSVISFMYRTEYNEGYPGCLITVCNTPEYICKLEVLEEPIYDWVFEKIEDIPCLIEFDFNINSHFSFGNSTLQYYVSPFYKELCDRKIKSILFSIDYEAFIIKTNPYINEIDRLEQFDIYTKKVIDKEYNEKIIKSARCILGDYWDSLSTTSQLVFPVGLDNYETYKLYQGNILDASPSAIQFCKCIEIEIEQKLLLPFKIYYNQSSYLDQDITNDLKDKDISRVATFLTKENIKPPELGTFAYFLSIVINSKSRANTSPTIKCYKEFLQKFNGSEFLISFTFQKHIEQITINYRNVSAHTQALSFDLLNDFYKILIGNSWDGFLFTLLEALETKSEV